MRCRCPNRYINSKIGTICSKCGYLVVSDAAAALFLRPRRGTSPSVIRASRPSAMYEYDSDDDAAAVAVPPPSASSGPPPLRATRGLRDVPKLTDIIPPELYKTIIPYCGLRSALELRDFLGPDYRAALDHPYTRDRLFDVELSPRPPAKEPIQCYPAKIAVSENGSIATLQKYTIPRSFSSKDPRRHHRKIIVFKDHKPIGFQVDDVDDYKFELSAADFTLIPGNRIAAVEYIPGSVWINVWNIVNGKKLISFPLTFSVKRTEIMALPGSFKIVALLQNNFPPDGTLDPNPEIMIVNLETKPIPVVEKSILFTLPSSSEVSGLGQNRMLVLKNGNILFNQEVAGAYSNFGYSPNLDFLPEINIKCQGVPSDSTKDYIVFEYEEKNEICVWDIVQNCSVRKIPWKPGLNVQSQTVIWGLRNDYRVAYVGENGEGDKKKIWVWKLPINDSYVHVFDHKDIDRHPMGQLRRSDFRVGFSAIATYQYDNRQNMVCGLLDGGYQILQLRSAPPAPPHVTVSFNPVQTFGPPWREYCVKKLAVAKDGNIFALALSREEKVTRGFKNSIVMGYNSSGNRIDTGPQAFAIDFTLTTDNRIAFVTLHEKGLLLESRHIGAGRCVSKNKLIIKLAYFMGQSPKDKLNNLQYTKIMAAPNGHIVVLMIGKKGSEIRIFDQAAKQTYARGVSHSCSYEHRLLVLDNGKIIVSLIGGNYILSPIGKKGRDKYQVVGPRYGDGIATASTANYVVFVAKNRINVFDRRLNRFQQNQKNCLRVDGARDAIIWGDYNNYHIAFITNKGNIQAWKFPEKDCYKVFSVNDTTEYSAISTCGSRGSEGIVCGVSKDFSVDAIHKWTVKTKKSTSAM